MKKFLIVIGMVCIAGAGIALAMGFGSRQSPSGRPGPPKDIGSQGRTEVPDFQVTTLDGRSLQLSSLKGKVVMVDFWATWCPPCLEELPHFKELYGQYKDKGFEMIGISLDEEGPGPVASFLREHDISYPVAMGGDRLLQNFGGILGLPTTFLLDKNGRIVFRHIGYQEKQVFEKEIQQLLAE